MNGNERVNLMETIRLVDRIIDEERNVQPNPFLATRIMASVEALDRVEVGRPNVFLHKVLKPVFISISIAAAAFFGVITGGAYQVDAPHGQVPVELSYLNDAKMESVDFYANN